MNSYPWPCRAYGWIELQVEGARFDSLLLIAGQFGEAIGEGIGKAEFHQALAGG